MKKILSIAGLRISTVILNFFVTVFIARNLNINDGGIFFFFLSITAFFSLISLGGLNQTAIRVVGRAISKNNYRWAINRLVIFVKLILFLSIVVSMLLILFNIFFVRSYFEYRFWYFSVRDNGIEYLILLLFTTLHLVLNDALRAFGMPNKSVISAGPILLGVFFTFCTAYIYIYDQISLQITLFGYFLGLTFSLIYALVCIAKIANSYNVGLVVFNSIPRFNDVIRYFKYSSPLLLQSLAIFLVTQSATFILGMIGNSHDISAFASAARLAGMFSFVNTIYSVFMPMEIIGNINKNRTVLETKLQKFSVLGSMVCLPPFIFVLLYSNQLMRFMYGESYYDTGYVLIALSIGNYVNVVTGLRGIIFSMGGRGISLLISTVVFGFLSIVFCMYGYYIMGVVGAALGVSIIMSTQCFYELFLVKKVFNIDPSIGFFSKFYAK